MKFFSGNTVAIALVVLAFAVEAAHVGHSVFNRAEMVRSAAQNAAVNVLLPR